eukprot:6189190-Ditylum_brightwellii.AAC.1
MKTAPSTKQSIPSVKQAVIASSNLLQDSSNTDSTTRTSYAQPLQMLHHPSTSSLHLSSTKEPLKSGSNSSADDVAAHVFPEKAGQIQKHYMWRTIRFGRGITVKE